MAGDTHFNDVVLLLHCDGSDNSTTFTDSSNYAHTVTAQYNAKIKTAQSKFGGASAYFNGSTDYLVVPHATDFDLSGSFTAEAWIYPTALTSTHVIFASDNTSAPLLAVDSSGKLATQLGGVWAYATTGGVTTNVWQHVAMVRSGSSITFYVNGSTVGSITNSTNFDTPALRIGASYSISYPFAGYIDEVRLTKGVARYTANFSPPTEAFPGYPTIALEGVLAVPYWIRHRTDDSLITDVAPDGSGGVWTSRVLYGATGAGTWSGGVYLPTQDLMLFMDRYAAQGTISSSTTLETTAPLDSAYVNTPFTYTTDVFRGVLTCSSGSAYSGYAASQYSATEGYKYAITKSDTSGVPIWKTTLTDASVAATLRIAHRIELNVAGSHIYAVAAFPVISGGVQTGGTMTVVKLSAASGAISWQRKLTPNTPTYDALIPAGIAAIADGNVYVAATAQLAGVDKTVIVYKYNSSGTLQWQKIVATGGDAKGIGLAIGSSENVYVAAVNSDTSTVHVVCIATAGTLTWQRNIVFTGQLVEPIGGVAWDSTNSKLYVTATVDSDHYISRLTSAGAVDWTRKVYRTAGGRDTAGRVKVDPTHGVFLLAGSSV